MTTRDPDATPTSQPSGRTPRRLALLAGPAEAIILVGGILLAAYVFTPTSSFNWMGGLEQFGVLRHYSIALGCLFGLVFLWPVWAETTTMAQRVGIGLFGLGLLITGGANALAAGGMQAGDWAIIGILLLFPVALLVFGGGDVYAGMRNRGSKSLLLGLAYIVNLGLLFAGYQLISYVTVFVIISVWAGMMYLELQS